MSSKETNIPRISSCWAFRIDNRKSEDLMEEIKLGHLRQGWGYKEEMNLRKNPSDPKVRKNLPIYKNVKIGDYLLVLHVPKYREITIVRATSDFDEGYIYDNHSHESGEYGHIFPVKFVGTFDYSNIKDECLRSSILHCRRRFFSLKKNRDAVNLLIVSFSYI